MTDLKEINKILTDAETIAVVGISRNPRKTSREIADFLLEKGYQVVGVNPKFEGKINNIDVYPSLADIPFEIDIVDVFRKSVDIPGIIDDILKKNPKTLWLQLGIKNDKAVKPVKDKGINVIQDSCIKVLYYNSGVNRNK